MQLVDLYKLNNLFFFFIAFFNLLVSQGLYGVFMLAFFKLKDSFC